MKSKFFNRVMELITHLLKQTTSKVASEEISPNDMFQSRLSYKYPYSIPIVEGGLSLVSVRSFCRPFAVFPSRLVATLLLLYCLGIGQMWGAEGDTHDFSQSLSQLLNNSASIADVTVAEQTYTVKTVKVTVNYNKTAGGATVSVKVGGTTFGSAQTINSSTTKTFTYEGASAVKGEVVVSSVNNCGSGTGKGTFKITNVQLTEGPAAGPSITTSATSVSNVGYSTADFSQQVQSFTVSGSSLTANVTVSAPTGFEVCKTSGGTYSSSVIFDKGSGTLSASTVYVRLQSGKSAGSYAGNITCSSTGATDKTVALSGSVPFTVTWKVNGGTYATTYVAYATSPGTAIGSFPTDPDPNDYCGDAFYGWYDGSSYSNASVAPSIIETSTQITTDKTYHAVFADASGSAATWTKVTSAPTNWSGDYVITNAGGSNAMISDFYSGSSGEFKSSSVTISGSNITSTPTDKMIWTFAKNGDNAQYSLKNKSTGTYAKITGTSSTNAALDASAVWFTISCSSGTCIISSVSYSARAFAWYSSNSTFRTYSNSGNTYCNLYKKTGGYTYSNYTTTCCQNLGTINGSKN